MLERAGINRADLTIAVTGDDEDNLLICQIAKEKYLCSRIIARVNNQIITRSEFSRSKDQLRDEVKQQDPNDADKVYGAKEKDVLRDLIDQQLLLDKGKDLGVTGDTDLVKRLDEMRKSMKLDSLEALEKEAEKQGISWEDFKQNMRNQIITQKVIGEEVGGKLPVIHGVWADGSLEAARIARIRPEDVLRFDANTAPHPPRAARGDRSPVRSASGYLSPP